MRIEASPINLMGIIFSVFWYAIYALALVLLSVSRLRLILDPSKRVALQTQSKFTPVKNSLNYKTT